jgi:hypothetical protein
LSELTGEQAESDMTSAAPLKPTTKALKALFLNAFSEFLLNISAFLEVSITSIKFIVVYGKSESQGFMAEFSFGVSPQP